MGERELTRIADEFLKRRIENIPGVGKAEVVGGSTRDILVQVDPPKLEALGLTLPQVMTALGQDTQAVPSGNLLTATREISVRVDAKARRVEDFDHVMVGNRQGRPIELREVATVVDGIKEKRTLARLDGQDAVALEIQKQIGGNTVAMVRAVDAACAAGARTGQAGRHHREGQGQLQVHQRFRGRRGGLHPPGRRPDRASSSSSSSRAGAPPSSPASPCRCR